MFEETITEKTSKKYARAVEFLNFILNHNLLDKININEKNEESITEVMGEYELFIRKMYLNDVLEIYVRIDNFNDLYSKKIKKTEMRNLRHIRKFWIYDKDQNREYIKFKKDYSTTKREFIHNHFWFKGFSDKPTCGF